jgi:hypothetical protein
MPTPPSTLYFDVKSESPIGGTRDYRLAIPNFTVPNEQGAQIAELRGWLTSTSYKIEGEDPERAPEWFYDLELDPAWLDQHGVDPIF